jgi:hypothetical protein
VAAELAGCRSEGDTTVTHRDGAGGNRPAPEGLSDAELEAETAVELPDREAMSIVGLPMGPLGGPVADVPEAPEPLDVDPEV